MLNRKWRNDDLAEGGLPILPFVEVLRNGGTLLKTSCIVSADPSFPENPCRYHGSVWLPSCDNGTGFNFFSGVSYPCRFLVVAEVLCCVRHRRRSMRKFYESRDLLVSPLFLRCGSLVLRRRLSRRRQGFAPSLRLDPIGILRDRIAFF